MVIRSIQNQPVPPLRNSSEAQHRHEELESLVEKLPKVDLHRHLEGSFTPEMVLSVARKHHIQLPADTVEGIRPYIQVSPGDKTLLDFLKKFDTIALLFQNKEAIQELTYQVIQDAAKENTMYLELRFAPHYMASKSNMPLTDIVDAVLDGIQKARKDFPETRVEPILIAVRHLGPEKAKEAVDLAVEKGIKNVDLASDELHFPPELFCHVFTEAKKRGLHVTIHAGEARGADSVRTAIECCQAERIGHGVRITEDPAVIKEVKEKHIPLEICPTSNVQTGAVPDWEHHPVKQFYTMGIPVTINTDDPGVSGITLSHEYLVVMEKYGFSPDDLKKMILNGIDAAFVSDKEKQQLREKFRAATSP